MIELFAGYGFDYRSEYSSSDLYVFTIKQGIFDNAIIIYVSEEQKNEVESELSKIGFSVKSYKCNSLSGKEDIARVDDVLFNAFFSTKQCKKLFLKDYKDYIAKVSCVFSKESSSYEYINVPFSINSEISAGNVSIIDEIITEINDEGPKLLIVEAAAGFGKTCTSYEVGKKIAENDDSKIVLFSELSRDRKARIFKHVLLQEIDRTFPSLSSTVVTDAIKKGKVTIILDGFDELLKDCEDEAEFEKTEAMLETIGELLDESTKVILTTRKTAILHGDEFHDWLSQHEKDFSVIRYEIYEPKISDWLSHDRIEKIKSNGINLEDIANPVLLSFLKSLDEIDFHKKIESPDNLVNEYFNAMMDREKDRQDLRLDIIGQTDVMSRLAQSMVDKNFTKDTRDNIVKHFMLTESNLIENIQKLYPIQSKPTKEELANKFANHALLDRSRNDDKIGFINDFVQGHFVANSIINLGTDWIGDEIFAESAVISYSPRSQNLKELLWNKLSYVMDLYKDQDQFKLQSKLLNIVDGCYNSSTVNGMKFDRVRFFQRYKSSSCIFSDCTFQSCFFSKENMDKFTFIGCTFFSCEASSAFDDAVFINCREENGTVTQFYEDNNEVECSDDLKVQRFILEKFWPTGRETITFAHRPISLFFGNNMYPTGVVKNAIEYLTRNEIIIDAKKKSWIGIDTAKIYEISLILGR